MARMPQPGRWRGCARALSTIHDPYKVSDGRVYCRRCGDEYEPAPRRVPTPVISGTQPAPEITPAAPQSKMYVTKGDIENGRNACRALMALRRWADVRLVHEHAPAPWRFLDASRRTVALGKAINRSAAWGQYEDYAFSLKRWRAIQRSAIKYAVPAYLVLTCDDGQRGYVPVLDSVINYIGKRGARGEWDRGDPSDDEAMVHIAWTHFQMIRLNAA